MSHLIEITINVLEDKNDPIEYEEVQLEVEFDFNKNGYETTKFILNGKDLTPKEVNDLKKLNRTLDKQIDRKIDFFIANYEEEYHEDR